MERDAGSLPDGQWPGRRRRRTVVAAIIAAIVLVLVILLYVRHLGPFGGPGNGLIHPMARIDASSGGKTVLFDADGIGHGAPSAANAYRGPWSGPTPSPTFTADGYSFGSGTVIWSSPDPSSHPVILLYFALPTWKVVDNICQPPSGLSPFGLIHPMLTVDENLATNWSLDTSQLPTTVDPNPRDASDDGTYPIHGFVYLNKGTKDVFLYLRYLDGQNLPKTTAAAGCG